MGINPVSNNMPVQSAPSPSRASVAKAATPVDSPVKENTETAAQESRETTAEKNAEALRGLSKQETAQFQASSPSTSSRALFAMNAYQK